MERRSELRLLCADLVRVSWIDDYGAAQSATANLEDISRSGACLHLEQSVKRGTALRIQVCNTLVFATVRYCVFKEIGYYLGVTFVGSRWSRSLFEPRHLFDPRRLLMRHLRQTASLNRQAIQPPKTA